MGRECRDDFVSDQNLETSLYVSECIVSDDLGHRQLPRRGEALGVVAIAEEVDLFALEQKTPSRRSVFHGRRSKRADDRFGSVSRIRYFTLLEFFHNI